MQEEKVFQGENESEGFNVYGLIEKYLVYWPWFVASVVLCVVACFVYLRFQVPVYSVNASVLIMENDKKTSRQNQLPLAMQDLGMFSLSKNFDNELEILMSRNLNRKVVNSLNLYSNTYLVRNFGYNIPQYKNIPVEIHITPEEAEKLKSSVVFNMDVESDGHLVVKAKYSVEGQKEKVTQEFTKLPAVFQTKAGAFTIIRHDSIALPEDGASYITVVNNPSLVAESYRNRLTVEPSSKTTTVAQISIKDNVKERGIDYINCLVKMYNQDTNDAKNEVANKTAEFIEERISLITHELAGTENELASFKQRSGLTDISSDAARTLQESSRYEQQRIENQTQIRLIEFLRDYIINNENEVIPTNVGLSDMNLSALINEYNKLLIERKRLALSSSDNNPAVVNLDAKVKAMQSSVMTSVNSVLKGLQIAQKDIEIQSRKYESRITAAPLQEKEFINISRRQEIVSALYTMLLQKREENAITLAATANNGRLIGDAMFNPVPVSPNNKLFLLVALVLGLALPVGVIYLKELLQFYIKNADDVRKITSVPVLAEIPKCEMDGKNGIVVKENRNGIAEESFREMRTSLFFMLEGDEKVIMFTSTHPSEGKSFLASNIAVSLSYTGKKVVIVGLDIRKPQLYKVFNFSRKNYGVTDYLTNPKEYELDSLIRHLDQYPNLDILHSGTVPPNPTELLMRDRLKTLIDELKQRYDYVIVDTAPIGIVTDTALVGRLADMCVYVCRAGETLKSNFEYINHLKNEKDFPKLATVVNGVQMTQKKYGYGKYNAKYGYGVKQYGYGYEQEER
jgi:tyrosine-protein kinase Etk/Wzc